MSQTVLINCNSNYLDSLTKLDLTDVNLITEDIVQVAVPDVNLSDEQLCTHYGIDYTQVYSIELC